MKKVFTLLICQQLQAQIYDGGDPSLNGLLSATITVRVFRNSGCPAFDTNYPATVNITQTDTGVIFTASATDPDDQVTIYLLEGKLIVVLGYAHFEILAICSNN